MKHEQASTTINHCFILIEGLEISESHWFPGFPNGPGLLKYSSEIAHDGYSYRSQTYDKGYYLQGRLHATETRHENETNLNIDIFSIIDYFSLGFRSKYCMNVYLWCVEI